MRILLAIKQHLKDQATIDKIMTKKGYFYAWQCVSLIMDTRTIDFIVPKRNDLLTLVNGLKTSLYRSSKEDGDRNRAMQFSTPLRVEKNNLLKMKISYAAFLKEMDVVNFIRHKFWGSALHKIE